MTLVIAGYSYDGFEQESIYFATDSNITNQNNVVLVNGFKKVIEIPIKIQGLNINGNWFNGYYSKPENYTNCTIAFAGSTLVAQHIINSIKNHLSELYPSHRNGEHILAMQCERNKHLRNGYCDEDILLDRHIQSLITADYISKVVEHSINAVLDEARKHTSLEAYFSNYRAEFLLGIWCPQDRNYYLYKYEIVRDPVLQAIVKKTVIKKYSIAIIGSDKFKQSYFKNEVFKAAFGNRIFTKLDRSLLTIFDRKNSFFKVNDFTDANERVFKLLNETIEYENSIRSNLIGKPSALFKLDRTVLKRLKIEK